MKLLYVLLTAGMLASAEHYIRPGAVGKNSGSDWNNAYTSFPSSLSRGDIYYTAAGTYPSYTFDDAVSGTAVITVKKATTDDHGTDTGWDDTYGDGQAVFDRLVFTTSYWVFDGAGRTGWDSGHGIKVAPQEALVDKAIRLTGTSNMVFRYIEAQQHGEIQAEMKMDVFYGTSVNNVLIQYCYIHDWMANGALIHGQDNIIEYCYFDGGFGYQGVHSQHVQLFSSNVKDMTIRYNLFEEIHGTAVIACAWGTDGLYVYGNVFNTPDGSSASPATICDISEAGETGLSNAHIYNNTFYWTGTVGGNPGLVINLSPDPSTNYFYNNAFYNCSPEGGKGVCMGSDKAVHGYNVLINSKLMWNETLDATDVMSTGMDPFVDPANRDFNLGARSPLLNAGLDLTTLTGFNPNTYDPNGTARGADGGWDVGAFEYVVAGIAERIIPVHGVLSGTGIMYDLTGRTVTGRSPAAGIYLMHDREGGQVKPVSIIR